MRKIFILLLVSLTFVLLVACGNRGDDLPENATIEAALNKIELTPIEGLEALDLPKESDGFTITWTSSDSEKVDVLGNVYRPKDGESTETITLTATIRDEDYRYRRNIEITLSPLNSTQTQAMNTFNAIIAQLNIPYTTQNPIDLPDEVDGVSITWVISDPMTIRPNGEVVLPIFANRDNEVIVTALLESNGLIREVRYAVRPMPLGESFVASTRTVDFINIATEYLVENATMELHYLNEQALPYVSMIDFIYMLEGAIKVEELAITKEGPLVTIHYESEDEDDPSIVYEYTMVIDFDKNTATINRFGFFTGLSEATQTDFGVGLEVVDYQETLYDPVVLNLGDYRFELLYDDDVYLMPLLFANLFFSGAMYDVYYNGDQVIGFDTYQIIDGGSAGRNARRTLNDTSYNNLDMPSDIKDATYRYLAFSFDYFYGLKGVHEVDTYYDVLSANKSNVYTGSGLDLTHYREMVHISNSRDDLHTWHQMSGIYRDLIDYRTQQGYGPRINAYIRALNQVTCSLDEGVTYYDNDRLARIFIDRFNEDTPVNFETWMDEIDAKGTVDRVVIDLTCNGGGILGTMIQILGYMTDDEIPIYGKDATALSTSTVWYTSENLARNYDWFIFTSPLTYSAANLMTSIAQEMNLATIIGQKSSGGASSITTNILPNGTILMMSSTRVLTDSTFTSIEFGIDVDIEIPFDDFDDSDALINATK